MQFVPFYFNAPCLYIALVTVFLTAVLLFIFNAFLKFLYRVFTKKNKPPSWQRSFS